VAWEKGGGGENGAGSTTFGEKKISRGGGDERHGWIVRSRRLKGGLGPCDKNLEPLQKKEVKKIQKRKRDAVRDH